MPLTATTNSTATIDHLVCNSEAPRDLEEATLIANCTHHRYSLSSLEVKDAEVSFPLACGNVEDIPHILRMPTKTLVLVDKKRNEVLWATSYIGGCHMPPDFDYRSLNFYREKRFKLNECEINP